MAEHGRIQNDEIKKKIFTTATDMGLPATEPAKGRQTGKWLTSTPP